MAEHEPSIGRSSGWLTPKPIFSGLGLTFELDPAHPGWESLIVSCRRVGSTPSMTMACGNPGAERFGVAR